MPPKVGPTSPLPSRQGTQQGEDSAFMVRSQVPVAVSFWLSFQPGAEAMHRCMKRDLTDKELRNRCCQQPRSEQILPRSGFRGQCRPGDYQQQQHLRLEGSWPPDLSMNGHGRCASQTPSQLVVEQKQKNIWRVKPCLHVSRTTPTFKEDNSKVEERHFKLQLMFSTIKNSLSTQRTGAYKARGRGDRKLWCDTLSDEAPTLKTLKGSSLCLSLWRAGRKITLASDFSEQCSMCCGQGSDVKKT